MPTAPLPETLPGAFFVLERHRSTKVFTIHVDDDDGASYRLGSEVAPVRLQFSLWGLPVWVTDRAIDAAVEFGACQCIWSQDRVINLFDRTPQQNVFNQKEHRHAPIHL